MVGESQVAPVELSLTRVAGRATIDVALDSVEAWKTNFAWHHVVGASAVAVAAGWPGKQLVAAAAVAAAGEAEVILQ